MGANFGQTFGGWGAAGSGSAYGAAQNSLNLGTIATGANVAGALFSGVAESQRYGFAASIADQNAAAALQAGQTAESQSKLKFGMLEGQQKAEQAASGVSVTSGSPLSVRQSTEQIGAMDATLLHFNAARAAWGETAQAVEDRAAARGAIWKGLYGAGSSFLSGAAGVSDKYLGYQLSGAVMKPSGSTGMQAPTVDQILSGG